MLVIALRFASYALIFCITLWGRAGVLKNVEACNITTASVIVSI
jgi:hypothetical protein